MDFLRHTIKYFDYLPYFRPIIDTTGTAYQPLTNYLFSSQQTYTQRIQTKTTV
jgi:hypothetical protein